MAAETERALETSFPLLRETGGNGSGDGSAQPTDAGAEGEGTPAPSDEVSGSSPSLDTLLGGGGIADE